jgi:hypothetical protein
MGPRDPRLTVSRATLNHRRVIGKTVIEDSPFHGSQEAADDAGGRGCR